MRISKNNYSREERKNWKGNEGGGVERETCEARED